MDHNPYASPRQESFDADAAEERDWFRSFTRGVAIVAMVVCLMVLLIMFGAINRGH